MERIFNFLFILLISQNNSAQSYDFRIEEDGFPYATKYQCVMPKMIPIENHDIQMCMNLYQGSLGSTYVEISIRPLKSEGSVAASFEKFKDKLLSIVKLKNRGAFHKVEESVLYTKYSYCGGSISFTLESGEVFTYDPHVDLSGEIDHSRNIIKVSQFLSPTWDITIKFYLGDFKSNKYNHELGLARRNYVLKQLTNNNIKVVDIDGFIVNIDSFHSADTIYAMLSAIEARDK